MKKIEDIFLPLNINREKKPTFTTSPTERPNNSVSLRKWLGNLFKGFNGITFDPSTFTFTLGGEITEDVTLRLQEGAKFFVVTGDNPPQAGLLIDETGVNIGTLTGSVINIFQDLLNITSLDELNIVSNNIVFKNEDDNNYLAMETNGGDLFIILSNLPEYADEAAAVTGGLGTNSIYKTPTGELRIKL